MKLLRALFITVVTTTPLAANAEGNTCALTAEAGDILTIELFSHGAVEEENPAEGALYFSVKEILSGDFKPAGVKLSVGEPTSPNNNAPYKAMWSRLGAPLCVTLTSYQALGVVYAKPGGEAAYDRYLEMTAPALAGVGGAVAARIASPEFISNETDAPAPYKATLVNWESADGPDRYMKSEGFNAALPVFNEGIEAIEWFTLKMVK